MMPYSKFIHLNQEDFTHLCVWYARQGMDMLLSSPGFSGEERSVIALDPVAELCITSKTSPQQVKDFSFSGGGPTLGFVSYTYGMQLRGITTHKKSAFPLGHLKKYSCIMEYASTTGVMKISGCDSQRVEAVLRTIAAIKKIPFTNDFPDLGVPDMSLQQSAYERGVEKTLESIRQGWTYQLNLSTQFTWDCSYDPAELFLALYQKNPAPFYGYILSGIYRVISTSPELFLRVKNGTVLSCPIKGTLAVDSPSQGGSSLDKNAYLRLTESAKESAELSMIVDLMRNDISMNCQYGSVRVEDHKSVFQVDNLLQMYSNVRGQLRNDRDCLDLFFDAFPGGSITGCPKISSMGIIDSLEPHCRDVYCGSLVFIEDERNMDSSIAIRTAVMDVEKKYLHYWAGSGIVIDSNSSREYHETLAKAGKFLGIKGK